MVIVMMRLRTIKHAATFPATILTAKHVMLYLHPEVRQHTLKYLLNYHCPILPLSLLSEASHLYPQMLLRILRHCPLFVRATLAQA